jgi:outer membrane lipoprotein SlyB
MKSKLPLIGVVVCAGLLWAGCTFPSSRRVVPAVQAGTMQNIDTGVVIGVREINIEGQKSNLGLIGGGAIGAAATKPAAGSGRTAALGQAAASVAGAVAGQAVEEVATRKRAQEITVRLDDGRTVVVTQEVSTGLYQDGDRVRIVNGGGAGARVTMGPD